MSDQTEIVEVKPHDDKYAVAKREREAHCNAVLQCPSTKRLVIAGPGTGKTYLFRQALKGKSRAITLSFVTALIEELAVELCGTCDVRTLHSFARAEASKIKRAATSNDGEEVAIKIFRQLSSVILEDSEVIRGSVVDFDRGFRELAIADEDVQFYQARKKYYNYSGFTDIIYFVHTFLAKHPERVPKYDQILVDEYQDFNALQVALIELLAAKSPILLAGDDDQSLYQSLTGASPEYIRARFAGGDFETFQLPYCSRCTRVIVDVVNDVLKGATANGRLPGRTTKDYRYFDDKDKDHESDSHPKIIYAKCFPNVIPTMITRQMEEFARWKKKPFTAMVICPTRQSRTRIAQRLKRRGFKNIRNPAPTQNELNLLGALRLLLADKDCNLGWRIAAKFMLERSQFDEILKLSNDASQPFHKLLPKEVCSKVRRMRATLYKIVEGKSPDPEKLDELSAALGIDARDSAAKSLQVKASKDNQCDPAIRNTPIIVTTIPSSKGLAADLVFMPYFDDRLVASDGITDQVVCNILVAFTRARTKLVLIATGAIRSRILDWINSDRIETVDWTSSGDAPAPE